MRTLLIDDESFMLKLISHHLMRLGFSDVITHERASDALALLQADHAGIGLVMCDLQMPEIDGIEVIRRLALLGYAGGVVLVSGEDDRILAAAQTLASEQHLHVLGVLRKPVSLEQMRAVLHRISEPRVAAGRNGSKVYRPDELCSAIADGQLVNVYQPKVDLETGAVVGVETLVRWRHPVDGIVFPDRFITLAEELGLIDDLTLAVLSAAIRDAQGWKEAGLDLAVAVNVSMDNLARLSFPDRVAAELLGSGLAASSLILEVTESRLMKDRVAALDILTRLRLKRIRLSIDDFGTGHSSLAQLRDLPFDELKIDRSFVHGAHRNAALQGILEGSLEMARKIGMTTVAEGVEDRNDWDFLRRCGCDLAQGYFIARPMPAGQLVAWVSGWLARRADLGIDTPSTWATLANELAATKDKRQLREQVAARGLIDRDAPAAPAPAEPQVAPPDQAALASLTSFDWLDTIADELVATCDARAPAGGGSAEPSIFSRFDQHAVDIARSSLLGRVLLGHAPIVDSLHRVIATRLTVVPLDSGAALDAGALLQAVSDVWPADGGTVSLNVTSETLLNDLMRTMPATNVMIEVPAFLASEPGNAESIQTLAQRGNVLLLKGRPVRELPASVLPCFKWAIIDISADRRLGADADAMLRNRSVPHIHIGVQTMAQLRRSFKSGAIAVIGWPSDDPFPSAADARPDLRVVLDLLYRVNRRDAAPVIEKTLVRDPVLAFELLRQVNSGAAPINVETASMQHAIALLGQQRMRRWLAQALGNASDDTGLRPTNFTALRRAILMRQLADREDPQLRNELFLCGLFSMLDRMMGKPIAELLSSLAVPERVRQALVHSTGPFFLQLELVRAIESQLPHQIRQAATAVYSEPHDINRALLLSLRLASTLEQADQAM